MNIQMEIFYSPGTEGSRCETESGRCILTGDEAAHCVKVLRHKTGDIISVINGKGTMYSCRILSASPKCVEADILSAEENWGAHPYRLHLAVAPTKNADRYEWFAEKACEIGVDEITPVIGRHSERKVFKTARIEKILISAAKQSLKGSVPSVNAPVSVSDFILKYGMPEPAGNNMQDGQNLPDGQNMQDGQNLQDGHLRLMAYCFEDESRPRISVRQALEEFNGSEVTVMIGPEGDFSREEAELAVRHGFIPVHLGPSRLRTETAAVTAAEAVYFRWMD